MAATAPKRKKGQVMEGDAAHRYERLARQRMQEYCELAERLKTFLSNGGDMLEIAPGPGFLAIEMARSSKFRVTGVDISKTFLDLARKNAAEAGVSVEFHGGNAQELPFAENSFDLLVCRAAFRTFREPEKALKEMYRVLRPHATGLIIDLRRDASILEIMSHVYRMHLSPWISLLTVRKFHRLRRHAYTKQQFENLLAGVGFKKFEVRTIGIEIEAWFDK
jgi:ubiquinone/menaquinone biosynthesis C-methylase UbiE